MNGQKEIVLIGGALAALYVYSEFMKPKAAPTVALGDPNRDGRREDPVPVITPVPNADEEFILGNPKPVLTLYGDPNKNTEPVSKDITFPTPTLPKAPVVGYGLPQGTQAIPTFSEFDVEQKRGIGKEFEV